MSQPKVSVSSKKQLQMACDRECSVCYSEAGPFVKLCCGHEFCSGCIKTWYLKGVSSSGANSACPMCRRPIYFRGFHALQEKWSEDAWEGRCAEIFSEALENIVTESIDLIEEDCEALNAEENAEEASWLAMEFMELEGPEVAIKFMDETDDLQFKSEVIALYRKYRFKQLMKEVIRLERTYRFLRSEDVSTEDIEDVLLWSDEYYSDRKINKWEWYDEPAKEFMTKYPNTAVGTKNGKRCRAREDPWAEMSFYILV